MAGPETPELAEAAVDAGADVVELGGRGGPAGPEALHDYVASLRAAIGGRQETLAQSQR